MSSSHTGKNIWSLQVTGKTGRKLSAGLRVVRVDREGVRRKVCAMNIKYMYAAMTISVNKYTVFRNVLLKNREPPQIFYAGSKRPWNIQS